MKQDVKIREMTLMLEVLACLEEWDVDLLAGRYLAAEQKIENLKGMV